MTIPLDRQIGCIDREIKMRRRVYPRWIDAGKLTQAKADEEIAAMEAVHATLNAIAAKERLI